LLRNQFLKVGIAERLVDNVVIGTFGSEGKNRSYAFMPQARDRPALTIIGIFDLGIPFDSIAKDADRNRLTQVLIDSPENGPEVSFSDPFQESVFAKSLNRLDLRQCPHNTTLLSCSPSTCIFDLYAIGDGDTSHGCVLKAPLIFRNVMKKQENVMMSTIASAAAGLNLAPTSWAMSEGLLCEGKRLVYYGQ
jgi:hypothetical protein